jgi:hypothetical protein
VIVGRISGSASDTGVRRDLTDCQNVQQINWQCVCFYVVRVFILRRKDCYMAKTAKRIAKRIPWSKDEHRALKAHSKAKTPVVKISKQMKRTIGALRQQALKLGIGLGHQR